MSAAISWLRGAAVLALGAAAACSTPPLTIALAIKSGDARTCPMKTPPNPLCSDVPLACDSMMLIRVVDPNDTRVPFISSCQQVRADHNHDLCAIASLDIPAAELPASLPERTLEVQVVVLPLSVDSTGKADCAPFVDNLRFALVTGVPQSDELAPPIGGHAYYHPGDAVTVVELGCNNLDDLNTATCKGANNVTITASVNELDTQISVSGDVAARLAVSVGEPKPFGSVFVLNLNDTKPLDQSIDTPPSWSADVDLAFTDAACLDVFDDAPESTPTLTCVSGAHGATSLDLAGVHVSRERLAQILAAIRIGNPLFTLDHGLVVGIALDDLHNPAAGIVVNPVTPGTANVRYLSADGTALVGAATTSSGIWISTDAPFGTTWTALTAQGFGGLVDGKVTVVVLQTAQSHT